VHVPGHRLQVTACHRSPVTGHWLQVTGHRLRSPVHRSPVRSPVTGHRSPVSHAPGPRTSTPGAQDPSSASDRAVAPLTRSSLLTTTLSKRRPHRARALHVAYVDPSKAFDSVNHAAPTSLSPLRCEPRSLARIESSLRLPPELRVHGGHLPLPLKAMSSSCLFLLQRSYRYRRPVPDCPAS
jgi:hypothetical protein